MIRSDAEQVLTDLLRNDLKIVFCGTQAGAVSAQRRAYYAGPGNRFWQTLHDVGLVPLQLRPDDYRQLLDYGIGLTDMAKTTSGPDAALRKAHFDNAGFAQKIMSFKPKLIAFNGKRAASAALHVSSESLQYGLQPQTIDHSRVCVLPSTSGAARKFWDVGPWREAANLIREAR